MQMLKFSDPRREGELGDIWGVEAVRVWALQIAPLAVPCRCWERGRSGCQQGKAGEVPAVKLQLRPTAGGTWALHEDKGWGQGAATAERWQ